MNTNSALRPLQDKLQKAILQLESDEFLKLMKNDDFLAKEKRQRIRQIIRQELQLEPTVETLTLENAQLKIIIAQSEELMNHSRSEYVKELQNIEAKWQQFRAEKEKEKKQIHADYRAKIQELQRLTDNVRNQIQPLKQELNRVKGDNQQLKAKVRTLDEQKTDNEEQIAKLRKQLAKKERELERKSGQWQEEGSEKQEYEQIISKMQQDMFVIRQSWEKKCQEIEAQLREENNELALSYEQKMRKQLKEHAQALQLGKNVVINDSEDIIARRVEKVQQEFTDRIHKLESQIDNLSVIYHNTQQELDSKEKIIKQLKNQLKESHLNLERNNKQMEIKNSSLTMEIESVRSEKAKIEKQLKNLKKQIEQIEICKQETRSELAVVTKKNNSLLLENERLEEEVKNSKSKITTLNSTQQEAIRLNNQQNLCLNQKDETIIGLNSQVANLKRKISALEQQLSISKSHNQTANRKVKKQKEILKRMLSSVDKMHLSLRKIKKENDLLKEDINCRFSMLQGKWKIESSQLLDLFNHLKEMTEKKCKSKMGELIDQLDVKEKELIDNFQQEKEQLKMTLAERQEALRVSEEERRKSQVRMSGSELQNKEILEELQKQRSTVAKFQQKIQHNEQLYQNTISKLQKDISRSLGHFHSRWAENIIQLQNKLDDKEGKISLCFQSIDQLSANIEQQKLKKDRLEQEIKKYKKKCEQLKVERDDEVSKYIRRFEQESKHRINLERELKEVRLSVMKGISNNSYSNFSFNQKEQAAYTNYKPSTNDPYKEKELSEIKEMIARTQKVFVDEPSAQRDITRHVSKKHLF